MKLKNYFLPVLLFFIPIYAVWAGTVNLPQTGQTTCWDVNGTVVSCTGTGDDGDTLAGVPGPSTRFVVNSSAPDNSNTVTDTFSSLIWFKDGSTTSTIACAGGTGCGGGVCTGGTRTWQQAFDYVTCLNGATAYGYSDWRLPNVNELLTLVNLNQPNVATWLNTQGFINVQSNFYWSSSTYVRMGMLLDAWIVHMSVGYTNGNGKTANNYVWPVRGGQP